MLLDDKLACRLDFTPRIRKLINNREFAIAINVETIKEWLIEEFLSFIDNITKIDMQNKIESLK
jgi:hypothetical protein